MLVLPLFASSTNGKNPTPSSEIQFCPVSASPSCSFLHVAQGRCCEKASHVPEEEENSRGDRKAFGQILFIGVKNIQIEPNA